MPENRKAYEGRATARIRKKVSSLLSEWYDPEEASGAMIKYLPQPRTLDDALHAVVKRKIPEYRLVVFELQDRWQEIAGEVAAKHTLPVCLRDGILEIEVAHPAYRTALSSRTLKEAVLTKIRAVTGEDKCKDFRLIPAGRRPPAKQE